MEDEQQTTCSVPPSGDRPSFDPPSGEHQSFDPPLGDQTFDPLPGNQSPGDQPSFCPQSVDQPPGDPDTLDGWTKKEKYELLMGLKYYGSHEIDAINVAIPSKTPQQIQHAILHYKKKALKHPIIHQRKRKEKVNIKSFGRIPLASWAKHLTDSLSYEHLKTETATALRLIAEFENIPTAVCTENVDFKKIYHLIGNAMEGKALPDDPMVAAILDKCIVETALLSKAFIRNSSLKYIVDNVDVYGEKINCFQKPTSNNELGNITHLASQKNYNPLNVPIAFLKPSEV